MDKKETEEKQMLVVDENTLTKAITNGMLEYDKKKEEEKQDQEKIKKVRKLVKQLSFKETLKAMFFPKKYANEEGANVQAIRGVIKFIYTLIVWGLTAISVLLIAYIPLQFCIGALKIVPWYYNIIYMVVSVLSFLISRVFAVMSVEIEKTKDNNLLLGLFASVIAIISLVIALIK